MQKGATVSSPVSGHHIGKLRRRRAILDAACDIIMEQGDAGLNMRAMAARAGVSPATPYNLFGSKQAVLEAIYEEDQEEFYRQFEKRAAREPLPRLFDMIDFSIGHWQARPDYYKALLAILYRNPSTPSGTAASSPRLAYVRRLIADAVAAGALRGDTPVGIVTSTLARIFRSAGQEWIDGALSLEQARDDLGRSFALVLAGLVTPASRDALATIGRRYEGDAGSAGRAG